MFVPTDAEVEQAAVVVVVRKLQAVVVVVVQKLQAVVADLVVHDAE